MKKRTIWLLAAMFVLTGVTTLRQYLKNHESRDVVLPAYAESNLEALAPSEDGYYRVQSRDKGSCTIDVGAKGKIKLLSGTILEADASGKITIEGEVVCSGTGEVYCKPVECSDLYQIIF